MAYVINEIYIKNFKSIDEVHLQNLDNTLIVLDGPNGFGKTSIFDAIEFVITGSIRRIKDIKISNHNRGFKDHLFAKNQFEPVIIKIQLKDKKTNNTVAIGRKMAVKNLNSIQKKPSDFISSLHILSDLREDLTTLNLADKNVYESIKNLQDSFKFHNYIEQENSSHFFKEQETKRMEEISKLFNIEKEEKELLKLKGIKSKFRPFLTNQKKELKKLTEQMNVDGSSEENNAVTIYQQVLPNEIHGKELWDQEFIKNFSLEMKNKMFLRIDAFQYLLKNFSNFKKILINEKIRALATHPDRIKKLLITSNLVGFKSEIIKKYELKKTLILLLDRLNKRTILSDDLNYELLYSLFQMPQSKETLVRNINTLKHLKKSNNQISNSMTTLMSIREKLTAEFMTTAGNVKNECPLCGHTHENYDTLIEEINNHSQILKEDMDSSSILLMQGIDNLYEEVFDYLIPQISNSIETLISDENYEIFMTYVESKLDTKKATNFFNDLGIDINTFLYMDTSDFSDLDQRVVAVKNLLEEKIDETDSFDLDYYFISKDIFENTFAKNEQLLLSVNSELLDNKKKYLQFQYATYLQEIAEKVHIQKKLIEKAENYVSSIDRCIGVYEREIQKHRANMVKEIEIPFYLYSGKIIQNYQRGVGVFIKEDRNGESLENKIIRFIPNNETDHDIVHSFSSGQLSATVIALTLAINKVYSSNNLNTILIDDPVQSMDDINMASFIELLRNDFWENQIILSTHNNNISLYMRYKFSKYGLTTLNINVKEKLG